MGVDLVLSSGFLAFGRQTGFLAAIEELELEVDGLCGTSSGALVGALWLAGLPAREIFERLTARPPYRWLRPHLAPWRGLSSLDVVMDELRGLLPPSFDGLDRPLGVGVSQGQRVSLLTEGPLVEAVAASCAVPWLFTPVQVGDQRWADGGAVDRTGLAAWRAHRGQPELVLHLVARSGRGADPELEGAKLVRSGRSGASLWSLGEVAARFEQTRAATLAAWG